MIFRLKRPLYEWRNFAKPGDPADMDLDLADCVKEWLEQYKIKHDAYPLAHKADLGSGEHTYLFFYIDIWDDKEAMLFKLTWM